MELSSINNSANDDSIQVSLAWRNLCYQVKTRLFFGSAKVILNRLNGNLKFHSLNAFLGPSGAGKTTLLNCLNGTVRSGLTNDSEIYLNANLQDRMPVIRFVEQHVHENIVPKMTIRHVLYYAFRFKNHRKYLSQMDKHIRSVLSELLLDESILENRFEQCSGGEQRRIAIAQELMSLDKPDFLFVDEPTTGLDSMAALLVIQCLRQLADNNRLTILISIHSPNTEIMSLFDNVYILAKGGICIYSDSPKYLASTLQRKTGLTLESDKPPIEEYMKIACSGAQNSTVRQLADSTLKEEYTQVNQYMNQLKFTPNGIYITHKRFLIGDLFMLLYRMLHILFVVEYWKMLILFLFFVIVYPLLTTIMDYRMIFPDTCYSFENGHFTSNNTCREKLDDEGFVEDYKYFQMYITIITGLVFLIDSTAKLYPILKMFQNEHQNRWYSMGVFYWSFTITRIIEFSLMAMLSGTILYFSANHQLVDNGINYWRIGHFISFIWLLFLFEQSYSFFLSILFLGEKELSILSAILTFLSQIFFSGYLIKMKQLQASSFHIMTQFVGLKFISNGLLYSFYGYDRCDPETEISYVLVDFGIDPQTVYSDIIKLVIHILMIRMNTFLLMAYHFSLNTRKRLIQPKEDSPKNIDYGKISLTYAQSIVDITKIKRLKEQKELDFEDFTQGKIIIAWRFVSLFATKSIYEIRSLYPQEKNQKMILRNLNGQFRFRTLNALMGTSGAGKTSFLKVLNGRSKTRLSEESTFYVSKFTPIRTCYLTQEVSGHLMPGLTAKQSLIYASRLKNALEDSNTNLDHQQIALNILNELDLADAKDTPVEKCSGGQRKRLALGLELTSVRMPNLICIDEPTSGLDSNSSEVVVACLKKIVDAHNLTIIASIHQPNISTLVMFDQVYMLAKGGVCIYSGPPKGIRHHLRPINERVDREDVLPVEELIKYSCMKHTMPEVQELAQSTNMKIEEEQDCLETETQHLPDGIVLNRPRFSMKSFWILLLRYLSYVKGYIWFQLLIFSMIYIFYALNLLFMFDRKIAYPSGCISVEEDFNNTCNRSLEEEEEDDDLESNFKYAFSLSAIFMYLLFLQSTILFSKDMIFFFNEHRNGWYTSGVFYLMNMIVEFVPVFFTLIVYTFLVDIYESVRPGTYFWLLFFLTLGAMAVQGLGHVLALVTGGEFTSIAVTFPTISIFSSMLGNLGTPIPRLHYIYQFIASISTFRFSNEALLVHLFAFDRCREKEEQKTLYSLKIEHDEHLYYCIFMLFFLIFFYHLLAFMILYFKTNSFQDRRARSQMISYYHENHLNKETNVFLPGLANCHQEFRLKKIEI